MKITILTENTAGSHFLAEHGLSYLLELDGRKLLFDAGHSDVFKLNAAKLGHDLDRELDHVVLSHGHWDHGNGLQHLADKPLLTHPGAFIKRYRKRDHSSVGLALTRTELEQQFQLQTAADPVQLSEHLYFLGGIPRRNKFEAQTTAFWDENGKDDFVEDDSALAAVVNGELVVITGCSHAGICNICEHAQQVTGISKLKAVIGGFHLKADNRQTSETIAYFLHHEVETILPSHCTDLPALTAFYSQFNIPWVKTGQSYTF